MYVILLDVRYLWYHEEKSTAVLYLSNPYISWDMIMAK